MVRGLRKCCADFALQQNTLAIAAFSQQFAAEKPLANAALECRFGKIHINIRYINGLISP
jgi:hypothetical protein